jgi:hypothetical protein
MSFSFKRRFHPNDAIANHGQSEKLILPSRPRSPVFCQPLFPTPFNAISVCSAVLSRKVVQLKQNSCHKGTQRGKPQPKQLNHG